MPKMFYLEEKLGISRPSSFPFNLNNAVDELLKDELIPLEELENHPYILNSGLDAKPIHPEAKIGEQGTRASVF